MALVLLALIGYGATAEAVHKHGNGGSPRNAPRATAQVTAHFTDSVNSDASSGGSRAGGGCLIC